MSRDLEPLERSAATRGLSSPPSTPALSAEEAQVESRSKIRRIEVLLELLDDESPVVWKAVREGLERQGRPARPHLKRAARLGTPRARARARLILLALGRERAARRLIRFACSGGRDLERGLWLLSRFEEPSLDVRPSVVALDAMGAEVARRVEPRPPGAARSLELAAYLGGELGYTGDAGDYHHPDNVYLHRAIVRKLGLPLTLSAIYLLVARRANLSAALVPMPGHVLLRLHGPDRNVLVDPFRGGREIRERSVLKYLAEMGLPFVPSWLQDASDAAMFERHARNLRASYERRGLEREVHLLDRVLTAMGRSRPCPAR